MLTKKHKQCLVCILRFGIGWLVVIGLAIFFVNCSSTPKPHYQNAAQAEIAREAEQKALASGKEMWFDPNLGTNGFSCETCHPNGDITNAESYPRFKKVLGKMATLSMTHNFAVVNESKGKPWVLGNEDANALVLYVKSLANGKTIRMAWPQKLKQTCINSGKSAFIDPALGNNSRTCQSCHAKGGKKNSYFEGKQVLSLSGVAAYYPRYSFKQGRVITLEQQINACIEKYLEGESFALDDETLVALCCYLTSLSEGKRVSVARTE